MKNIPPEAPDTGRGEFVGPYELIRPLGRGGMGDVQLARRADGQYLKLVAVKRLLHVDSAKQRERFYAERQILAHLSHPNIAALLDGGETPDGQLYVVMEYIDGIPLLEYAERAGLGVEKRLGLFLQVCSAVQHAHRNLIVHRDLKPSNILVTGDGAVKLIDFGIAKALLPDHHENAAAVHTQTGDTMLTPLYASPEQVRGEMVTTASDVYALGVLLFELLAGSVPYPATSTTGLALAEAICSDAPRLLSEAAVENGREKWRARLAGDLENIAAMALRKEPERRYSSVEQLAADIERHLTGFPVLARPDSVAYRLTRLLRRNRAAAAAAAVVVVLLAGSSAINYRTARRAQQERDTARSVANFLASIFSASDPFRPDGKEFTASELLARGEARIDTELKDQPEVQARLLMTIGETHHHTGNLQRALKAYDRALALRVALHGENHPDVAETLREKGRLIQLQGQYKAGEELLRRALQIQQEQLPKNDRETLRTAETLGLVMQRQGRLQEAAGLLKSVIETLRQQGEEQTGSADDLFEDTLNNYALVIQDLGRFDETEQARRTLVELERKRHGESYGNYLVDLNNLGVLIRDRDALEEAEPLLRRALEGQRKILQPGSFGLINSMQYLAICLQRMGQLDEAEALWKELRPQRIKLLGEKNRFVGNDWAGWGEWLQLKGDLPGAEAAVRKAIEIREAALAPAHPSHGATHGRLARILQAKGDLAGAEREFRFAYDTYRRAHGESNPRTTAGAELELGNVLWQLGRNDEAGPLLEHAYKVRKGALAASDRQLADATLRYGQFLRATGRTSEGDALVSR